MESRSIIFLNHFFALVQCVLPHTTATPRYYAEFRVFLQNYEAFSHYQQMKYDKSLCIKLRFLLISRGTMHSEFLDKIREFWSQCSPQVRPSFQPQPATVVYTAQLRHKETQPFLKLYLCYIQTFNFRIIFYSFKELQLYRLKYFIKTFHGISHAHMGSFNNYVDQF